MKKRRKATYLYIACCSDGSYYTGISGDVEARIKLHNTGRGAKYTSARRPVTLIYSETHKTLSLAMKREREIKSWPRSRKEALVQAAVPAGKRKSPPKKRSADSKSAIRS
jgi:putative endonuclease